MNLVNSVRFSVALFCLLAVPGCIMPYPHTTENSPDVRGIVLDAATRNPIQGAIIAVYGRPKTQVLSDATGEYHLPAHHDFHLFGMPGICGIADLTQGKPYCDLIEVKCLNYQDVRFNASYYLSNRPRDENGSLLVREVLLKAADK